MDLAAGFGLRDCIVGFSLLVPSGLVDIMEACLDVRSDKLIFDQLGLARLSVLCVGIEKVFGVDNQGCDGLRSGVVPHDSSFHFKYFYHVTILSHRSSHLLFHARMTQQYVTLPLGRSVCCPY